MTPEVYAERIKHRNRPPEEWELDRPVSRVSGALRYANIQVIAHPMVPEGTAYLMADHRMYHSPMNDPNALTALESVRVRAIQQGVDPESMQLAPRDWARVNSELARFRKYDSTYTPP